MHFGLRPQILIDIAKREVQVILDGDQTDPLKCGNHAYFHSADEPEGDELARADAAYIGYSDNYNRPAAAILSNCSSFCTGTSKCDHVIELLKKDLVYS